jgi:hypothetical protein
MWRAAESVRQASLRNTASARLAASIVASSARPITWPIRPASHGCDQFDLSPGLRRQSCRTPGGYGNVQQRGIGVSVAGDRQDRHRRRVLERTGLNHERRPRLAGEFAGPVGDDNDITSRHRRMRRWIP